MVVQRLQYPNPRHVVESEARRFNGTGRGGNVSYCDPNTRYIHGYNSQQFTHEAISTGCNVRGWFRVRMAYFVPEVLNAWVLRDGRNYFFEVLEVIK